MNATKSVWGKRKDLLRQELRDVDICVDGGQFIGVSNVNNVDNVINS